MGNAGMYYAAGPWHHDPELSMHGTELVYGKDGYLICDAGRIPVRSQQTRAANARLIAAAPAMAEALETILRESGKACLAGKCSHDDSDPGLTAIICRNAKTALRAAGVIE